MAHSPERPERYVCTDCQVVYAGTPIHHSGADHSFEPPEDCRICGETELIAESEWIHYHE